MFSWLIILQLGSAELFTQESKFLIYGNGKDKPATGIMFEKEQMHGLYFNQSPPKVPPLYKLQGVIDYYANCLTLIIPQCVEMCFVVCIILCCLN